ncbi:hypothetical protein M231_05691 [Tremella mesenterica]|uniref:Uncharacterized protein n=1 Tax=Tremella mesenterica TaxID=5217 RepID=A0A4Q1BHG5_TREME|nr:hypothetical protein M231_05691 [Tremella mesenterica]
MRILQEEDRFSPSRMAIAASVLSGAHNPSPVSRCSPAPSRQASPTPQLTEFSPPPDEGDSRGLSSLVNLPCVAYRPRFSREQLSHQRKAPQATQTRQTSTDSYDLPAKAGSPCNGPETLVSRDSAMPIAATASYQIPAETLVDRRSCSQTPDTDPSRRTKTSDQLSILLEAASPNPYRKPPPRRGSSLLIESLRKSSGSTNSHPLSYDCHLPNELLMKTPPHSANLNFDDSECVLVSPMTDIDPDGPSPPPNSLSTVSPGGSKRPQGSPVTPSLSRQPSPLRSPSHSASSNLQPSSRPNEFLVDDSRSSRSRAQVTAPLVAHRP